jgi:trehalose synthase-fused probable maltokinase
MTDVATRLGLAGSLGATDLAAYLARQRWFNTRSKEITGIELVDAVPLPSDDLAWLVLVDVQLDSATHDVYQLVIGIGDGARDVISTGGEHAIGEASSTPDLARALAAAPPEGDKIDGTDGTLELHGFGPKQPADAEIRLLGVDQSNTSLVVGNAMLTKMYRRVEPGLNPELEMLLFFTEREFAHVPHVTGWYGYVGSQLRATLGVSQRFLADARDGWELGLEEVPRDANRYLERIEHLGAVIGEMHMVLGSDGNDPAFAPEDPTPETASLLNATIEDGIEDLYAVLPEDDSCAPLAGRAEELREVARSLAGSLSGARLIRTHGDLHLGQVLWSSNDWYVSDFEGEPDRSVAERRRKTIALRDVAGMFRSFAYLTFMLELRGNPLPEDFEQSARERFLVSYREVMDGSLLMPNGAAAQERLLDLFELEKVLYEMHYELQHRPEWVGVPMAGLTRFLERERA